MQSAKSKSAAVLVGVFLAAGCSLPAIAQQSGSGSSSSSGSSSQAQQPAAPDNSFPEDLSRKAAAKKKADEQQPAPGTDPAPDSGQTTAPAPSKDDNAFPEDTSRKAADAAKAASSGSSSSGASDADSNSGVSSSGDYDRRAAGRTAVPTNVPMAHVNGKDPVKEDVSIGGYYLEDGNYKGAYQRFKEATTLAPENTDAMFGLAEAARHLKMRDEAMTNYQLFLDVVTSGSKAKDARKAMASLEKGK